MRKLQNKSGPMAPGERLNEIGTLIRCAYLHVKISSAHSVITQSVRTLCGKRADIYAGR